MMDQKVHSLLTTTSGRQHYLEYAPAHVDKLISERRAAARKNAELNLSQLVSLPLHGHRDSNVLIRVYNVESIEPFYGETELT